jgi:methionyl-tRNA formyltransferase
VESKDENQWYLQPDQKNMALKKLKIVIWCGTGANQKALANKIAALFDVAGIVTDAHAGPAKKSKRPGLPSMVWDRLRFRKIYTAWKKLMNYYNEDFPSWPPKPLLEVPDINSEETKKFTRDLQPDLIVVSGTSLIKKQLISIPVSTGIINLHTGLSPYVKGGPNCTNWCIANNNFHLVGNTIMWLNEGIDAGNIITTETVNIEQATELEEAHRIVMEHAHDLYVRTIRYLSETTAPYNAVPQDTIDQGQFYLTKMWTAEKRKQLLRNWKKRKFFKIPFTPKTISI